MSNGMILITIQSKSVIWGFGWICVASQAGMIFGIKLVNLVPNNSLVHLRLVVEKLELLSFYSLLKIKRAVTMNRQGVAS